jgi:hypothetical protein
MSSDTPVETVLDVAASPQQQGSRPQPPADTAPLTAAAAAQGEAAGAGASGDAGAVKGGSGYISPAVVSSAPLPPAPHPSISSSNIGVMPPQLGASSLKSQPPGTIVIDQRMNRDYNQGGLAPRSFGPDDYLTQQLPPRVGAPSLALGAYPTPGGKGRGGPGGMPGPTAPVLVSTLSNGQMLGNSLQMPPQHQMVQLAYL